MKAPAGRPMFVFEASNASLRHVRDLPPREQDEFTKYLSETAYHIRERLDAAGIAFVINQSDDSHRLRVRLIPQYPSDEGLGALEVMQAPLPSEAPPLTSSEVIEYIRDHYAGHQTPSSRSPLVRMALILLQAQQQHSPFQLLRWLERRKLLIRHWPAVAEFYVQAWVAILVATFLSLYGPHVLPTGFRVAAVVFACLRLVDITCFYLLFMLDPGQGTVWDLARSLLLAGLNFLELATGLPIFTAVATPQASLPSAWIQGFDLMTLQGATGGALYHPLIHVVGSSLSMIFVALVLATFVGAIGSKVSDR